MNRNVQHSITAVAFSPDGKTLVISGGLAGNEGSGLRVWDVASGKKLKSLGEPFFAPDQVAYSSDGRFLATSGREAPHVKESEAIIWDPAAGVQRTTLPHPAKVGCLAFVAGNELLATGLPGRYSMVGAGLRLWDVSTGASRGMLGQADRKILSLAASADGRILASLGSDGIARIWDVAARKETARIQAIPKPPPASPQELYGQLALSPDGTTLVVVGSFSVGLWDARTGAQLLNCPHVSEPYRDVAISPDGRTIAMTLAPVPRGDVAEPTSGIDIWNLADLTGRASARGQ
jgi:WD40 repeat protein